MKLTLLLAATAMLGLTACSTTDTGNNDTSRSTRSQAGGTVLTPNRSADPRFLTGNARVDDFTPAPPSAVSLTFVPEGS